MSVMITWLARTLDPSLQGVTSIHDFTKSSKLSNDPFSSNRDEERKPFSNHLIRSKNKYLRGG
jgi:hypothetical protein